MTTATVVSVERKTRPGTLPSLVNPAWHAGTPAVEGWEVKVRIPEGEFHFSRLDGETDWTADAFFPAGVSMPTFMHGFGSRCTIPRKAGDSLVVVIDAAVADAERQLDLEVAHAMECGDEPAGHRWSDCANFAPAFENNDGADAP